MHPNVTMHMQRECRAVKVVMLTEQRGSDCAMNQALQNMVANQPQH